MSLYVSMNIFAGRPNPSWSLSGEQENDLWDLIHSLPPLASLKPHVVRGGLGYQGFYILSAPSVVSSELRIFVNEGLVDTGMLEESFFDEDRKVERWLLETSGDRLDQEALDDVAHAFSKSSKEIIRERLLFELRVGAPAQACSMTGSSASDAPPFQSNLWNGFPAQGSNCYSYANNKVSGLKIQPGMLGGSLPSHAGCDAIKAAAIIDKLISVTNFKDIRRPGEGWYVALFVRSSGSDYHWYRQDADGCWSHKPGDLLVSRKDEKDMLISDPESADLYPYTVFCGYMATKGLA